jgi:signal transduction histidine kinase
MSPLMERIDPRRSLAAAVAWELTAITLLAAVFASLWFSFVARNSVKDQIGATFRQYATQISNELDVNLYAKLQALQSIRATTSFFIEGGSAEAADRVRRVFPRIQEALPEMEWVGFAAPDGRVLAASSGLIAEAADVSQQQWFREGSQSAWIGDVHDEATTLALTGERAATGNEGLIDLSVPVRDGKGKLLGVIGAKLGLAWIQLLETSLADSLRAQQSVEILLVARDGLVLLGPPALIGRRMQGPVLAAATDALETVSRAAAERKTPPADRTSGQLTLLWQDGREYLSGFAVPDGSGGFPGGMGWTVWVREPTDTAFALVEQQWRQNLLTIALLGLFTAVAGAFAARRLTRRLTDIASSADDIRAGRRRSLDVPAGVDEAARIGRSLQALLDDLEGRTRALEELNAELDARVAARTREAERLGEENRQAALVRERLRFARNLHDTLAHSIMELLSEIRLMRKLADTDPSKLKAELESAEQAAREGLQRAREAISELRRDVVRDMGLGAGLRQLLDRMRERLGIAVDYAADAAGEALADSRAETLCRIADEALRNIELHARAQCVKVTLRADEGTPARAIMLSIEDDGVGFDEAQQPRAGHFGLRGMRELADIIGASLAVSSETGRGTRIVIRAPV